MKLLITSLCLAAVVTAANAETLTIGEHTLEVKQIKRLSNTLMFTWDDGNNPTWVGISPNNDEKIQFLRRDERVKDRGWRMIVSKIGRAHV